MDSRRPPLRVRREPGSSERALGPAGGRPLALERDAASRAVEAEHGPDELLRPHPQPRRPHRLRSRRPPSGGGELVRYDSASGLFVPYLGGLSAREVEFSRDGRWIAYERQPDGTLWRSRPDGTEPRQLTFPQLTGVLPRWSPDGRSIAYMSFSPGEKWESHVLAAEGGKPRPVTGRPGDTDPSWSPEGARLVLGRPGTARAPEYLVLTDPRRGTCPPCEAPRAWPRRGGRRMCGRSLRCLATAFAWRSSSSRLDAGGISPWGAR